ncbi:MAG: amidohydrolase [Pirellulaceae bacterium]|jgi:predicted amidohydrolase YtcJ|nr:amidohydrolase [Pirellulaceae bacterium]
MNSLRLSQIATIVRPLRCFISGLAIYLLVATADSWVCAQGVDRVFLNGKVVTVDAEFSIVQAVAVAGDRIVAVGSNEAIRRLANPATEVVDLDGAMMLPGLIDSHVHAANAASYEFDHVVPDVATIGDVLKYIGGRAQALPEGEWVSVHQMFITRLAEQRFPTREELDQVSPRNPVVFQTGPDLAVNSLALELSGIDDSYQLPSDSTGRIERDAQGRLNGIIRGASSIIKYKVKLKSPTLLEMQDLVKKLFHDYNSVGITSVSDRNTSQAGMELYQSLLEQDALSVRVFMYYGIDPNAEPAKIRQQIETAAGHPLHAYNNRLWLRGIKVFLDGGMLTGSAFMREPWGISQIYSIDDPDYRGTLKIAPERLYQIAEMALAHELQMTAHAVGDGAVHNLIDAYERVAETIDLAPARPCITHCNFMSADAISRMKNLGIVADLQPAWLYLDGVTLAKQFGLERLEYFQPYRSLFDAGVVVGGGSDHMQKIGSLRSVNPYNPFLGMWIALTRVPRGAERALHPEQRISRQQVLRLYTINNAYLSFEEQEKGSIEKGKLADLIVIDRDLLECPLEDVRSVKVLQTYLGGEKVFDFAM